MTPPFKLPHIFAIVFGCLVSSSQAMAESQLRLETDSIDWRGGAQVGYNVFDPGEYAQTIQFKVHLIGDPCAFFVTFGGGVSGQSQRSAGLGGDSVTYGVYDSVNRRTALKNLPGANANEVIQGNFALGETVKELSYTIIVPSQQVRPAGRYTDLLKITVYEGTPGNFVERDSRTVVLTIPVAEVTELALVEPGAPFEAGSRGRALNFDKLAKGKTRGFDLRVRSNVGYQVKLQSEYGGIMTHTDPTITNTIPYTVAVGGGPVNLRDGAQIPMSHSKRVTDRNGDRHEVSVVVGDTSGAVAGTYRDYILVTVIFDG